MNNKFISEAEESIKRVNNSNSIEFKTLAIAEAQALALIALAKEFNEFNEILDKQNGLIDILNRN